MKSSAIALFAAVAFVGTIALDGLAPPPARAQVPNIAPASPAAALKPVLAGAYGRLPLSFEANQGQSDPGVDFLARGAGYTLFLTASEAVLALRDARSHAPRELGARALGDPKTRTVVGMRLNGAMAAGVSGEQPLAGKANYFIGNDPARWHTDIPTYAKVVYRDVYRGIDLTYYGDQGRLEYDFVIAPGADPGAIRLQFTGIDAMEVDPRGDLALRTGGGEIHQQRPLIYQEAGGVRTEISGNYVIRGDGDVGFALATYDPGRPLVIDPVLVYSTYLGGGGDDIGFAVAVDAAGSAYVTGSTDATGFPTQAPFQSAFGGVTDAFVSKLNPAGSALVYSTYLGGSNREDGFGVAVDAALNAYITGNTSSPNFPTQAPYQATFQGVNDVFVTKLNPAGNGLVYSTYIGGHGEDDAHAIAVDGASNAYITGLSRGGYPITMGSAQPVFGGGLSDAIVTKLNPAGSALVYSTYLGGASEDTGLGIAVDNLLNAYVTGDTASADFPTSPGAYQTTFLGCGSPNVICQDAFVTKLNSAGSSRAYSTYLAGTSFDEGHGIAVDTSGNAYVAGWTFSTDFPTTTGAFQTSSAGSGEVFVTKLNSTGSAPLLYSTYIGGSGDDEGFGIGLDTSGNVYITGSTSSTNFPTNAAVQPANGGGVDAFVTKLSSSGGALVYSTYLGGSGAENALGVAGIAVDGSGSAFVTGSTSSTNFPTTAGAFDRTYNGGDRDVFVAKIAQAGPPATLTLMPKAASNPVDTEHCVTATVEDGSGNPVPNVTVRFSVTGSVNTTGSKATDANGQATFCYDGPALPGDDAIEAYADSDNDGTQDAGEPFDTATKAWVLPVTTPLCEVIITNGGRITTTTGDRATFAGNAKSSDIGQVQGQETYQDHGPAQALTVKSIDVLAIVCEGSSEASIYGKATVDGSGSFFYRIKVKDLAEPGIGADTYWILVANGYSSGEHTLEGGNVQIRRG